MHWETTRMHSKDKRWKKWVVEGQAISTALLAVLGEELWNNATQHATPTDKGTTTSSQLTRTSALLACLLNHGPSQDSRES